MKIVERRGPVYVVDRSIEGSKKLLGSFIVAAPNGDSAIIDPGPSRDVPKLLALMEEEGLDPRRLKAIIVTHIHLDHGGGAGLLHLNAPWSKVYVHPRGAPHLVSPGKLWEASRATLGRTAELYGEPEPLPEDAVVPVADSSILELGGLRLRFIHTPGHASHHMSILLEQGSVMFTGDSAGMHLCGRLYPTTPFPFKLHEALASLDKMLGYNPSLVAYTHFGIREGAPSLLKQYKELLKDLASRINELLERGLRGRSLVEELRRVDPYIGSYEECLRELGADYMLDHADLSVDGIARYLEKFGLSLVGV